MTFSQALVQEAGACHLPGALLLEQVANTPEHPLFEEVHKLQTSWEVGCALDRAVAASRLAVLRADATCHTPRPYQHTDLRAVSPNEHGLVPLSEFDLRSGGLRQGGSVFEILPSIVQKNSCYWVAANIGTVSSTADVRVRLDPFMVSPASTYAPQIYTMQVWGGDIGWDEVLALRRERTWRWTPDRDNDTACTEAVWTPRGDEVHFQCEEIPKPDAAGFRASRYFHTIVNRSRRSVVHFDGAIRIMDRSEAQKRASVHMRDAGKGGTRIKVFQVDGDVAPQPWSALMAAFFVWNDDAESFARGMALGSE